MPEPSRRVGAARPALIARAGRAVRTARVARPGPAVRVARIARPGRAVRAALGAVALVATIVACGAPTVSSLPSASPSGAVGVPATSGPLTDPPPATSASIAPIVVDPTLLALLPARVDGVVLEPAADAAGEMTADPSLAASASAIAVGVVATGNATGDDFASASVVRLRPGIYSEAFFQDWRQSYDAAACAPAGGVASHRQQVIGAHTVEVTLCTGGARTLHVHLAGDILISITAVGDRGFGDLVLAGLRE